MEVVAELLRRLGLKINAMPTRAQARVWESLVLPHPILKEARVERVTAAGVAAEWIIPKAPTETVILFFHGGWYSGGSLLGHREFLTRIAVASGARVLAPDYRLAPEHPYPAGIDDGMQVWQWLTTQVSPKQIIVAGDSCGSGLSLALMLRLRAAGAPLPKSAILICPWVDLSATGGSLLTNAPYDWAEPEEVAARVKLYLGAGDPKRPEVSPVFADLRGLPPMLVQAGGAEMLLDQETMFVERARATGVDVTFEVTPDMIHDWQLFATLIPEGLQAIERLGAFAKR
jgi:acetyl esterase/lipase